MSFDIFFTPSGPGKVVQKENPFTGQVQEVVESSPLSAAEVKAVRDVLSRANAQAPDEHDCYVVQLKDGGSAEVFASNLDEGVMVALRGLTPDVSQFLFELLRAANWSMAPAMEDAVLITAHEGTNAPPDSDLQVVVVASAEEVGVLLTKGVRSWEKYRDQVLGKK